MLKRLVLRLSLKLVKLATAILDLDFRPRIGRQWR